MESRIIDIIEYMPLPFSTFEIVLFCVVGVVLFYIIIKLFIKLFKPKVKSKKELLEKLSFNKKEDLFTFTKLAKSLDNSSKLNAILKELEEYKFSKESKPLPIDLKKRLREYIRDV